MNRFLLKAGHGFTSHQRVLGRSDALVPSGEHVPLERAIWSAILEFEGH